MDELRLCWRKASSKRTLFIRGLGKSLLAKNCRLTRLQPPSSSFWYQRYMSTRTALKDDEGLVRRSQLHHAHWSVGAGAGYVMANGEGLENGAQDS
ncbi:hypothetical protein OE88DRAFT_319706 [Heliocybe sulcata]|uniref:Uncharacterized protein n=1 Tax=Heliocybe sulcata TaxID=5364 RepID=A0A5C3MZB9_9AGAM|nr:hypothetical protein OE88DRAFT_319706 [Heliocybe sulcata]